MPKSCQFPPAVNPENVGRLEISVEDAELRELHHPFSDVVNRTDLILPICHVSDVKSSLEGSLCPRHGDQDIVTGKTPVMGKKKIVTSSAASI